MTFTDYRDIFKDSASSVGLSQLLSIKLKATFMNCQWLSRTTGNRARYVPV